jgi:glycosyltransferase involved in cell wall biosynthesis
MKLGVVIPTYRRADGTTPYLLRRALESVKAQTYQNFVVYLIGDNYEDSTEFLDLMTSVLTSDKIRAYNLEVAEERVKYKQGSEELWCAGGVNATNFGIDRCLEDGLDFICHLDHDDYWEESHLEVIVKAVMANPNARFVHTCSTYFNNYLPFVQPLDSSVIFQRPRASRVVHSSTCVNFKALNIRYRDVYQLTGKCKEADADLWRQVIESTVLEECLLIKKVTCYHPTEKK